MELHTGVQGMAGLPRGWLALTLKVLINTQGPSHTLPGVRIDLEIAIVESLVRLELTVLSCQVCDYSPWLLLEFKGGTFPPFFPSVSRSGNTEKEIITIHLSDLTFSDSTSSRQSVTSPQQSPRGPLEPSLIAPGGPNPARCCTASAAPTQK